MAKRMMPFLKKPREFSSARHRVRPDRPPARRMLDGMELQPDLSGALYVADYRTLLVADLHFKKGSSFANRGLPIPPHDTRSTLVALEAVIERLNPERLIALGDSFHDRSAADRIPPDDLRRIRAMCDSL